VTRISLSKAAVQGFLDRLAVEEASPLLEALALEVQRDAVVRLVGAELVTDLLDEQVADPVTDHGCPSSIELLQTEDTLDGRSPGRRGGDRRGRLRSPNQSLRCAAPLVTGQTSPDAMKPSCGPRKPTDDSSNGALTEQAAGLAIDATCRALH
jgi:hypothetical protein